MLTDHCGGNARKWSLARQQRKSGKSAKRTSVVPVEQRPRKPLAQDFAPICNVNKARRGMLLHAAIVWVESSLGRATLNLHKDRLYDEGAGHRVSKRDLRLDRFCPVRGQLERCDGVVHWQGLGDQRFHIQTTGLHQLHCGKEFGVKAE